MSINFIASYKIDFDNIGGKKFSANFYLEQIKICRGGNILKINKINFKQFSRIIARNRRYYV